MIGGIFSDTIGLVGRLSETSELLLIERKTETSFHLLKIKVEITNNADTIDIIQTYEGTSSSNLGIELSLIIVASFALSFLFFSSKSEFLSFGSQIRF